MQSLFPYAVNTARAPVLGCAVRPAVIYQPRYTVLHKLLLQSPLCDTACQAKAAVLYCERYVYCHVVSFHPCFAVKPMLLGSTGSGTLWLYYLLCITCTCMQCKSFVEQKEHEMTWMKVFCFFYPESMSYPKPSHKKYWEKFFERDIDIFFNFNVPLFFRLKMCLRPIAR